MIISGVDVVKSAVVPPPKRRLAGNCTVNGAAASKRVVVQKRSSLEYVASTHSKTDGSWEIRGVPVYPEKSLVAIAFDDTGTYNAEILDYLSQVE